MENIIKKYIESECEKLIKRHHDYHNSVHKEHERRQKILGHGVPPKVIRKPDQWAVDRKFNPFYVRRNSAAIAKSISRKISAKTYAPEKPFIATRPKTGGGYAKHFNLPNSRCRCF